jgi:hypothetical protein
MGVSFITSIILSTSFYFLTNNFFFLFLIVPSVINAMQDFTRYGLIALDLRRQLVTSDAFWFFSTFVLLTFYFLFPSTYSSFLYLTLWSLFGLVSFFGNIVHLRNSTIQARQFIRLVFGPLEFSLLLDKVFPRVVSESQYFLLNIYFQNTIAHYRIANLLMGFSNVLIMSHMITWVRDGKLGKGMYLRQSFFAIFFLNFSIAIVILGMSEQPIALYLTGLSLAAILDLLVTRRVVDFRLRGSEYLPKSVLLRVMSSLLLLIGFTATLVILPLPLSVASAAPIGSLFSLLCLRFVK